MNVLVIYNSRNGHTRDAAEAIADAARGQNSDVIVKSVAEVRKSDVEQADTLFVGTWVHGLILFGVRPAGAEQWVPSLPTLTGKKVGVFCTYAFHPHASLKTLSKMLKARGATITGQHAFHRSQAHLGVDKFVREVLYPAQGG